VARDGQLTIEDMDSHNGTFVRGDRVRRRALAPEDMIRIGGFTVLKYCLIDSVEEELRRRLLAAALRDPLTGVHNRRHFDERLAAECAAARRHERPLSLLMVDVDDFKAINDRHGHRVGDAVLRAVAQALLEGVRREDAVFRYGGEEFAILLRETGLAGAVRLADRLRKRVAKLRAPGAAAHGARITVTISIGAAAYTPDLADGDLIERADAGLYRAKRQGKDRVVSAG
jgi:diguanylate cyclase (GGDEF)-like protein